MGNCFSSEKAASPDGEPSLAAVRREKPGSLPHIEETDGKLSTSVEFSGTEKAQEEVPPLPTTITTTTTDAPKSSTIIPVPPSPQDTRFSEPKSPREPQETSPQAAVPEEMSKRESGSTTVDSGKGMSVEGSVKDSTVGPVEEEPVVAGMLATEQHSPASPSTAAPDVKDEAPMTAEETGTPVIEAKENSVATLEPEQPAAVEQEVLTPVDDLPVHKEETHASTPVAPTPEVPEEVAQPVTAADTAADTSNGSNEPKATPALPQLNTILPPSSGAIDAGAVTTTTTISPSSLKSPHTALTHQDTSQTTPPGSARPMTASSSKGGLSLFPAEVKVEPPSSPITVPITPQNTATDPSAPVPGVPGRTQSTTDNKAEKAKRQSRISRMFSVANKKDKSGDLPLRNSSKKQRPIAERPAKVPPVPAIYTQPLPKSPTATGDIREDGATKNVSEIPKSPNTPASPTELASPTVEGRKWNQEGDNDSLYCY